MTTLECAFCDPEHLAWRTIRTGELCMSIVSGPWFRPGHCLVIPKRHIVKSSELEPSEAAEIMMELGRLSLRLDEGYGTGIMQKYQPKQAENGIKVNHLHFHVFPRHEVETGLFPVPEPNSFDGFYTPTEEEVVKLAESLR